MNKHVSILTLGLAGFILAGEPAAALHCDPTVNVGTSGTDDYSDLQYALTACNNQGYSQYDHNLRFKLNSSANYEYVERDSVEIPYGYNFQSGHKLVLDGTDANGNSSSLWDGSAGRFVFSPDPLGGAGYAIFASGWADVVIRGVQFKVNISDDWEGANGILVLKGNVTVEDCFIWMYTPTSINWSQKGIGIKMIGDGNYVVKNTIIYGDYRATPNSAYFDSAIWAGTYSGTIDVFNTTIYGKGVVGSSPPETYPAFAQGVYRRAAFTADVSNSYIHVYGPCTSGVANGDYNGCLGSQVVGSNSFSITEFGGNSFVTPRSGTAPNFTIQGTNSQLYDTGSTTSNYADPDINGGSRPSSGSIDIGADEY